MRQSKTNGFDANNSNVVPSINKKINYREISVGIGLLILMLTGMCIESLDDRTIVGIALFVLFVYLGKGFHWQQNENKSNN